MKPGAGGAARRWGAEIGLVFGALMLNSWALSQNGYGNSYYAAAIRSMTTSWHNFVYASYDPGGFITTDKPPFALWVQAASAKIFGYSSWSILLPSAVAGAASVGLLVLTVRRVWGRTAGLVAGLVLALTPMMFAVSRSSNPDAILVLMLVAAAWATERAIATDQFRWSAVAGVFVGLGFLTKMLAAFIVVPALGLALLVGVRSWRRSVAHGSILAGVLVALSLAWIALMDLTSSSPFVGGSDDGSAWNLVFGYNGFGRVFGSSGPAGGGPGGFGPGGGPPGGGPLGPGGFGPGGFGPGGFGGRGGVDEFGGTPGIGRLFNMGMGDQVMWLSLLAGAALVSGAVVVLRRRRGSDRASAASLVTFGVWAITGYALFAFSSGIFHNYYVSAIAPALAALVGIGAGLVLNGGRVSKVVAALAMAGTAAIELVLIRRVQVDEWLRVVAPLVMLIAAAALAAWAIWPSLGRWRHALIGGGVLAALLAPAMWVGSALTHAETATFPDARPGETSAGFDPGGPGGGGPGGGPGGFGAGLDAATIAFLEAHTTTERWIVAVASSQEASAPIIDGHSVMSMGGFSGTDPAMTPDRLASLVRAGELRFISAGGPVGGPGGFGGPGGPAGPGGFGGASSITNVVAEACTAVDDAAVSSTIYDCAGAADAISRAGDQ